MIASKEELEQAVKQLHQGGLEMGKEGLHYANETESLIQQAYEGRCLFELIQNARDASQIKGED